MTGAGSLQTQIEGLGAYELVDEHEATLRIQGALRGLSEALTEAHARISTQAGLRIIGELGFQLVDMEAEVKHWASTVEAVRTGAKSCQRS